MFAAALAGLTAGLIHVLSGPDHLAAVAPLANDRSRAWRTGFLWGLGHSGGVFAVALLASQCPDLDGLTLRSMILDNASVVHELKPYVIGGRFLNIGKAAEACHQLKQNVGRSEH